MTPRSSSLYQRFRGKGFGAICLRLVQVLGHTPVMSLSIIRSNRALRRHRGITLLCVMALLGLIISGIPHWDTHRHELADHGHGHHHQAGSDTDAPGTALDDDDSEAGVTHFHASAPVAAAVFEPALQQFHDPVRRSPSFPPHDLTAPAGCWLPPYRPPIA